MRIRLHLKPEQDSILPLNYQYELSAWIYEQISRGSPGFGKWLHQKGVDHAHERFKLFTFSNLMIPEGYIAGDRRMGMGGRSHLDISFLLPQAMESFVQGLFRGRELSVGDRYSRAYFEIAKVESMPEPTFRETMVYRTTSPILVQKTWFDGDKRKRTYIKPGDEGFAKRFLDNLVHKYLAFVGHEAFDPAEWDLAYLPTAAQTEITSDQLSFAGITEPRSQLVKVKANTPQQTRVRGFQFRFRLTAPICLQRLGYYAGFGASNAIGFGCTKVWRQRWEAPEQAAPSTLNVLAS